MRKNAECGGVILEARKGEASHEIQQNFFDIYNERIKSLCTLENNQDKINTFIVCEKTNTTYGLGIQVLNLLNSGSNLERENHNIRSNKKLRESRKTLEKIQPSNPL